MKNVAEPTHKESFKDSANTLILRFQVLQVDRKAKMNEPIRILQVVSYMSRGGVETLLMNLYRNIDRSKVQFDFLEHTSKEADYDQEIEALGGRIYRIPRFTIWNFGKQLKEYDKFFKEHPEYKIVHSHINLSSLGVLKAACKSGVPTRISHLHSSNLKGNQITFSYRCKKLVFPLISKYLTHRFACSQMAAHDGFGKNKDVVIFNNGVLAEKFRFNNSDREKQRKILGWNDKLVLLNVARFNPQKNHSFLVDIFNEVLKRRKDVILVLVGVGNERVHIETQVKQLGLGDYVQFLGSRTDVPALLNAADLFVFPSLFEGFPVSLVEAQASGVPIIASTAITKETGITDLIRFVSLDESPKEWARIILEETEQTRKPREIYAEVVKNAGFDIKNLADSLADFYLNEYQKNLDV